MAASTEYKKRGILLRVARSAFHLSLMGAAACLLLLSLSFFATAFKDVGTDKAKDTLDRQAVPSRKGALQMPLFVDSRPPRAGVIIDGQVRGSTPLTIILDCDIGSTVSIEVQKEGYPLWQRTIDCVRSSTSVMAELAPAK